MRRIRGALLAVVLSQFACMTVRTEQTKHAFHVVTEPENAVITVSDARGTRSAGRSPADVEVEFVEQTYDVGYGWWIASGLSVAMGGVGTALALSADKLGEADGITGLSMAVLGGTLALIFVPITIIMQAQDGEPYVSYYESGPPRFDAQLAGYATASTQFLASDPPPDAPVAMRLQPLGDDEGVLAAIGEKAVVGGLGLIGKAIAPAGPKPVVAVFEIVDRSKILEPGTRRDLTEHLSTKLAEQGFRLVPASEVKARLSQAKLASYDACVDEACQIELGKAVAAEQTLQAKLIKVGDACTLNGAIYDLKTETTATAASVRTACDQQAILDAIESLAAKLAAQD